MTKIWEYRPLPGQGEVEQLSKLLSINSVLSGLLLQRGITDFETAKHFFRPSLDHLHDPFLMTDMDHAVNRIRQAMDHDEKILIYGDYDVDGTTAVSMCYDFFKKFYGKVDYYIPDRYKEGYGVSKEGIDYAIEEKVSLIICLDCGIKAIEKVAYAKAALIDFIICDHHRPGSSIPEAIAVLDPKREDCNYPFDELSGCGVGFKLLQAFAIRNGIEPAIIHQYLDLVAVSIGCDIVPITDENRVLAYYGMLKLNDQPRIGLDSLIEVSGFQSNISITNVVFGIGPRINAAGRIAHARAAVELLTSNDKEAALAFAQQINVHNLKRKDFDSSITEEAFQMIENDNSLLESKSTVLYKKDWHKGVIGIVASRCIERYYRPTIIMTSSNDNIAGSARSVDGFDVYEAISECSDLLVQFGGHRYAAGLTMVPENVDRFQKKFEKVVASKIKEEQMIPRLEIDYTINLDAIDQKFYRVLKQMGPFGPGNMVPLFVVNNAYCVGRPKLLKEKHVKFRVGQNGFSNTFNLIGFGFGKDFDKLNSGCNFSIAFSLEENTYLGNTTLQLFLKDIKFEHET